MVFVLGLGGDYSFCDRFLDGKELWEGGEGSCTLLRFCWTQSVYFSKYGRKWGRRRVTEKPDDETERRKLLFPGEGKRRGG